MGSSSSPGLLAPLSLSLASMPPKAQEEDVIVGLEKNRAAQSWTARPGSLVLPMFSLASWPPVTGAVAGPICTGYK